MNDESDTPSESEKFTLGFKGRIKETGKGMEKEARTSKEKAGSFLARRPRPCRRVARVWVVLAQLGLPVS